MSTLPKLKPCPFCGSRFLLGREPHDNHPVAGKFYIFHEYGPLGSAARKCRIDVQGHFETEAEAIGFWNTRKSDAENARLRDLLTALVMAFPQIRERAATSREGGRKGTRR